MPPNLPKMHPREAIVRAAANDLRSAIVGIEKQHELTELEVLSIVGEVLGGHINFFTKYAIREERHGDKDKPGGLE